MSELDKDTLTKGMQILTDQLNIVNNTQREHARTLETHQAVFEEVVRQVSTNGGRITDLAERVTAAEQHNNQVSPTVSSIITIINQIAEAINHLQERISALENTNTRLQTEALPPVAPQMTAEGETIVNATVNVTFDPGRITLNDLLAMSPQLAIGLIRRQGVRNPQIEEAIQTRDAGHTLANRNGDRFEPAVAVSESMAQEIARIRAGGQLAPQAAPVTATSIQPNNLVQMYIEQQGINGIGRLSRSDYAQAAYGNTVVPIVGARTGRLNSSSPNLSSTMSAEQATAEYYSLLRAAGVIDAAGAAALRDAVPNTPLAQPDDRRIDPNL